MATEVGRGLAQQGVLNHEGGLPFNLLQKASGGFQQSSGLMEYSFKRSLLCREGTACGARDGKAREED